MVDCCRRCNYCCIGPADKRRLEVVGATRVVWEMQVVWGMQVVGEK